MMSEQQFRALWESLGSVVWSATQQPAAPAQAAPAEQASAPEPQRTELSCTQARTDARWQPHHQAPASPRAFGFGPSQA